MSDSPKNPERSDEPVADLSEMMPPELSETRDAGSDSEPLSVVPHVEEEAAGPMISFSHVSLWFGEQRILDNVSFEVMRAQTLCILGRSGVGKSVSLRILMGFLKPQVGSMRLEGEEINGLSEEGMRAVRKRVTMVFQNGALFDSMSVYENVAFPLRERGNLAEDQISWIVAQLIGLVGAEEVTDQFPASLSTGRKRAVAIARALAAQPEVVLYDEPTTMVDPIIARRLGDLIQRAKDQLGVTSIVVTHDMRLAERLADLVLFLDQGQARYFGPLAGFMHSSDPHIQQFLMLDAYKIPSA
jgi:phospholipid/cholesterol/gamma-HCH transport system ATP-binding protein